MSTSDLAVVFSRMESHVSEHLAAHRSPPGGAVALVGLDDQHEMTWGVTSLESPQEVDRQTYFRIGSLTKTFTALAALDTLASAGIAPQAPVSSVLGGADLSRSVRSADVSFDQLMTHRSGLDGDSPYASGDIAAFGRGDDATARALEWLATFDSICEPGGPWSYSNTAFWVLAECVSRLAGTSYEDFLTGSLLPSMGLPGPQFFGERLLTRRTASGHLADPEGRLRVVEAWDWPGRAAYGSGGLCANLDQVCEWTRWWIRAGVDRDTQVGSVTLSDMLDGAGATDGPDSPARGWLRDTVGRTATFGHGGTAAGQQSRITIFPQMRAAIVVLTNSHDGFGVARAASRSLVEDASLSAVAWAQPRLQAVYRGGPTALSVEQRDGWVSVKEGVSRAQLQGRRGGVEAPERVALAPTVHSGTWVAEEGRSSGHKLTFVDESCVRWRGRLCFAGAAS